MTGFAPWERLPDGNGITYLETARAGRDRIPTRIALFSYANDDALQLAVTEFELEIDESANKEVAVFEADESKFVLGAVATVYHYPTETDGYACRMWVDSERKQAIIERMWLWRPAHCGTSQQHAAELRTARFHIEHQSSQPADAERYASHESPFC